MPAKNRLSNFVLTASLIFAGLAAKGTTTITDIEHVLRGYENIIEKLNNVGAKISLEEI